MSVCASKSGNGRDISATINHLVARNEISNFAVFWTETLKHGVDSVRGHKKKITEGAQVRWMCGFRPPIGYLQQ